MYPYISGATLLVMLKRICPKCRKKQITSVSNLRKSVTCKNCGAKIPPSKGDNKIQIKRVFFCR